MRSVSLRCQKASTPSAAAAAVFRRGSLPSTSSTAKPPAGRISTTLKFTPSLDNFLDHQAESDASSRPPSLSASPVMSSATPAQGTLQLSPSLPLFEHVLILPESEDNRRRGSTSPRPRDRGDRDRTAELEKKLDHALTDVARARMERDMLAGEVAKLRRSAEHAMWSLRMGEKSWTSAREKLEKTVKHLQADLAKLTSEKTVIEEKLKAAQEPWILAEHNLKRKISQMQLELDMRVRETKSLKDSVRRVQQYAAQWRRSKDEALKQNTKLKKELDDAHEALATVVANAKATQAEAIKAADTILHPEPPTADAGTAEAPQHVALGPSSLEESRQEANGGRKRTASLDSVPESTSEEENQDTDAAVNSDSGSEPDPTDAR